MIKIIFVFLFFISQRVLAIELEAAIVGNQYYIDVANFTQLKSIDGKTILSLDKNDKVEILTVGVEIEEKQLAEVKVIESKRSYDPNMTFLVLLKVLSVNPSKKFAGPDKKSKYFIIQNVASERLRVYERCIGECLNGHKMIFETEMAVGDVKKGRTWLGVFFVRDWFKFYSDTTWYYPSWYDPKFPPIPKPPMFDPFGFYLRKWLSQEWLPISRAGQKIGRLRGAFGWYTALMAPEDDSRTNSQWMHGTLGWGSEGNKYIDAAKGTLSNLFAEPRSNGCSKLSNPAIAYLNYLIGLGTPVYKIYAIEGSRVPVKDISQNYPEEFKSWSWTLTTDFVRENPKYSSDSADTPQSATILETGVYEVRTRPTVVKRNRSLNSCFTKLINEGGDVYCVGGDFMREKEYRPERNGVISDGAFKGVFLVDEGRLFNYSHPTHEGITVGGFKVNFPSEVLTNDENFYTPTPTFYNDPDKAY